MRAARRVPMPDLDRKLSEANALLKEAGLPLCASLEPVADGDTANPTVIGHAGARKYVIKTVFKRPDTLLEQFRTVNWFRINTELPVPEHFCYATDPSQLPLMIMAWMPGEQLRLALPAATAREGNEMARDWGRCFACFHVTEIPEGLITSNRDMANTYWGSDEQFQEAIAKIDALCAENIWSRIFGDRVKEFLEDRRDYFVRDAEIALLKVDVDLRDFLAVRGKNARISAVLDWECVRYGFAWAGCLQAYMRLVEMGREALWPAFCEGYEAETGKSLIQSPDIEYGLLMRCLVPAAPGRLETEKVIQALVEGRNIPFEEREID